MPDANKALEVLERIAANNAAMMHLRGYGVCGEEDIQVLRDAIQKTNWIQSIANAFKG